VKLTGFLIVAFSAIGVCSAESPLADAVVAPAPSSPVTPAADIVVEGPPYVAITPWQRFQWFDQKTFGVSNLGGTLPGAAWGTLLDRPHEAGPHWQGFAERYGVAMSTNAVSNTIEASLGAIWGEDPRYKRAGAEVPFKSRLSHVAKWTVLAPNRNGELRPAYARFIAISSASFISNSWREPSDTDLDESLGRIAFGLLGHMVSNAFDEFWPDAKRKLFHHN
jgi:hypothetical protein